MSSSNGDGPEPEQSAEQQAEQAGARACVELSKTASGKMVWKVRAYSDDTAEGLIAAKDVVVKVNGELAERYPG